MRPLYLTDPVRDNLGPWLRPGGESLSRFALDSLNIREGKTLLDAGCGRGSTLALSKEYGVTSHLGIDLDCSLIQEAIQKKLSVLQASMDRIPVQENSFDCIITECAWNLSDKEKSTTEFSRILRPDGLLAISDIYLRSTVDEEIQWPIHSCFAGATGIENVKALLNKHGFSIHFCKDFSDHLKQTAAEFVFAHGSIQQFWQAVTGSRETSEVLCKASKATRPGLFFLLAQRK